jgi:LysR family transcriptional regulator, glycine cleavage system transcriptional activator
MTRLPPLTALRAFEAAARTGSFTVAAQELFVTTGAVSRQVKLLEAHLGVALFARHHRKVVLTAAGNRYAQVVAGVFADLTRAGDALKDGGRNGRVRIDCVPTLSMYWLTPRLPEFHAQHPDTRIEIETSLGPVDVNGPFDLAIRRDTRHFSGLTPDAFMTEWCVPLCSETFAREHDLRTPDAMLTCPTIHIRAREDLWPTWTRRFGLPATLPARRLELDHTFAAMQAAEDGLGIVVIPLMFVRKLVSAGRLFAPFPEMLAESGKYYVLNRDGARGEHIGQAREWLLSLGKETAVGW